MNFVDKELAAILFRNWWLLLLRGLVAIAFGVLVWFQPGISLAALLLLQPFDQLQTLSVGQTHICDQHGELLTPQQGTRLLQIGRAFDHIATALQRDFIQGAQIRLVINNKHGSAGGIGRHG